MSTFQKRKQKILQDLAVPEDSYNDLSPKGSIDAGIRDLVDQINNLEGFVTTSSCAGRIAVYVEGNASGSIAVHSTDGDTKLKTGSKGGGRWLFVSHDLMSDVSEDDAELMRTLGLGSGKSIEPSYSTNQRFVHFKFEPMILHVLCSSVSHAKIVLAAAMGSGFRESGISSINSSQDVIMAAVRTNGLAFDSIVAALDEDDTIQPCVPPAYIRMLIQVANARFAINQDRTLRFRDALIEASTHNGKDDGAQWEPAEARRLRKRAEGLQRQQQARREADTRMQARPEQGTKSSAISDLYQVGES